MYNNSVSFLIHMYNKKQLSMIFPKRRGRWCAFSFFYQLRCNLQRHLFFLSVLDFRGRRRRIRAYSQTLYRLTLRTFRAPAVRPGFRSANQRALRRRPVNSALAKRTALSPKRLCTHPPGRAYSTHISGSKNCVFCVRGRVYTREHFISHEY